MLLRKARGSDPVPTIYVHDPRDDIGRQLGNGDEREFNGMTGGGKTNNHTELLDQPRSCIISPKRPDSRTSDVKVDNTKCYSKTKTSVEHIPFEQSRDLTMDRRCERPIRSLLLPRSALQLFHDESPVDELYSGFDSDNSIEVETVQVSSNLFRFVHLYYRCSFPGLLSPLIDFFPRLVSS